MLFSCTSLIQDLLYIKIYTMYSLPWTTSSLTTQEFQMFVVSYSQTSFLPSDLSSSKIRSIYISRKIVATATYPTTEKRAPSSLVTDMASPGSLYDVLGISMGASSHEIKAAYRKLARRCHPDVVAMNQKEASASQFMEIHSAYSTLSDPDKRAQYDRQFHQHRRPLNYSYMTSSNISSMPRRYPTYSQAGTKWETDQCW